jgi:hypothetical protein
LSIKQRIAVIGRSVIRSMQLDRLDIAEIKKGALFMSPLFDGGGYADIFQAA